MCRRRGQLSVGIDTASYPEWPGYETNSELFPSILCDIQMLTTCVADPLSNVLIRVTLHFVFLQLLSQSDVNIRFGNQFENLVSYSLPCLFHFLLHSPSLPPLPTDLYTSSLHTQSSSTVQFIVISCPEDANSGQCSEFFQHNIGRLLWILACILLRILACILLWILACIYTAQDISLYTAQDISLLDICSEFFQHNMGRLLVVV